VEPDSTLEFCSVLHLILEFDLQQHRSDTECLSVTYAANSSHENKSQFHAHGHASRGLRPKSDHLVMLAAKAVVCFRRLGGVCRFEVEFSADEHEHDLHLHHGEAFAETGARALFETAEGVFRLFVAGEEEAVGFEGQWVVPEVCTAADAVVRDPEDVVAQRELLGGLGMGYGLDWRRG
jgi:hypothetical protein